MKSATARVFAPDLERAKVIGAVRQQTLQEVFHEALQEYVTNHRDELGGRFRAVQRAVLDGDRELLAALFAEETADRVGHEAAGIDEAWAAADEG